jgi:TRAP-type mannitol/chloroaromatic compound transport system permease large subunit
MSAFDFLYQGSSSTPNIRAWKLAYCLNNNKKNNLVVKAATLVIMAAIILVVTAGTVNTAVATTTTRSTSFSWMKLSKQEVNQKLQWQYLKTAITSTLYGGLTGQAIGK